MANFLEAREAVLSGKKAYLPIETYDNSIMERQLELDYPTWILTFEGYHAIPVSEFHIGRKDFIIK